MAPSEQLRTREHRFPSGAYVDSEELCTSSQRDSMETPGLVRGEAEPFSKALRSLINYRLYSDVRFVVGQEQQEVFAHWCLLACRCNFFQRLLGPEPGPGVPGPVVLSTVPAEAFLAVLEFLYTNSVKLHRHSVLTAAVEYGLEELRELCLEFVVKVLDSEQVCEALQEAQGAGLRVAGVADWASRTLSSRRHWRHELSVCAMAAPEAFGRPGAPADSRPASPRSKAKAGELAGCLLRHKAFRKPPPRRRLSEGLVHRRTASPLVHQPPERLCTCRDLWELKVCGGPGTHRQDPGLRLLRALAQPRAG
ncbi:LOW QUALITY PROTEIN: hypothetical protein QTO34_009787 [Cnephaeus nilssonii]|uniref:BTB domain-containing protein n=1 Tax=Cnephaeus nilssonii TaxID=3371016 RepID=A0AA40HE52_CNENI|nr:LOW QUALITY PROTEIN: hypothetical protein QTO34_009787 [Eptesicus nilssonii]